VASKKPRGRETIQVCYAIFCLELAFKEWNTLMRVEDRQGMERTRTGGVATVDSGKEESF